MKLQPPHLTDKIGYESIREFTLRHARSDMGRELIRQLGPTNNEVMIHHLLDQTAEMMRIEQEDDPFPLRNLHDIREFLKNASAEGALLSSEAFVDILEVAATSRNVKNYIKQRSDDYPTLYDLSTSLIPLEEIENQIKAVISDQGSVRDDASNELRSIRKQLNQKRSNLRDTVNKKMHSLAQKGMTSDEGATLRNGRMVIPILAENKRKVDGFVHDVSSSGQTVYIEPVEALSINNEIRQLEIAEDREIERILRELTSAIRKHIGKLRQNLDTLAEFDLVAAKTRVGIRLDGHIPAIRSNSDLYLAKALNPILLLKNLNRPKEEKENVVPLNLELTDEEQCLVITGPNAGGKSVAMKTLGLCVLMAQSGYPIPAADTTELPITNGLFVDMGDDQSIEDDLSTFSSRLQWMRETLTTIEEDSLVLIDEAAAGTDPEEGGTLFQALIEKLLERESRVIVTTHHGSLKVFAHEHPKAINGSMEFDQATLSPTYRFQKGIPGSSYAFEIAERMELSDSLLTRARELLGEAKGSMESLITDLEAKTQEAEQLKSKFSVLKSEMEAQKNKFEDKREALQREEDRIREKALKEAKEIMGTANKKIEEAVRRIRESEKAEKDEVQAIREEVDEYKESVHQQLDEVSERTQAKQPKASKQPPDVGDQVRFADGNTTGELVDVNGKKAVVSANGLRLKTDYSNLVKVADKKEQKKKQSVSVKVDRADESEEGLKPVGPSLDIRGYRGQEAINELTKYIDTAISRGMNEVEIIHGKGQGILRKLVHAHLEKRDDVQDYDIAPLDRGGAGCTIVQL